MVSQHLADRVPLLFGIEVHVGLAVDRRGDDLGRLALAQRSRALRRVGVERRLIGFVVEDERGVLRRPHSSQELDEAIEVRGVLRQNEHQPAFTDGRAQMLFVIEPRADVGRVLHVDTTKRSKAIRRLLHEAHVVGGEHDDHAEAVVEGHRRRGDHGQGLPALDATVEQAGGTALPRRRVRGDRAARGADFAHSDLVLVRAQELRHEPLHLFAHSIERLDRHGRAVCAVGLRSSSVGEYVAVDTRNDRRLRCDDLCGSNYVCHG